MGDTLKEMAESCNKVLNSLGYSDELIKFKMQEDQKEEERIRGLDTHGLLVEILLTMKTLKADIKEIGDDVDSIRIFM